jgi:Gpi18-like mannosyltransferase
MIKSLYQKLTITKIIVLGLFLRLISWPWIYNGDVTWTYWWGRFATEFTWRGYYDWLDFGGHGRPDLPMLNIYLLWFVRQIYIFFYNIFWYLNVNIPLFPSKFMQWYFIDGNQYLIKIPMILADIAIIYFCYKFTRSKIIALVLALFPPMIYNSAVWGSGDSIVNIFALLGMYFLWKKKIILSVLLYSFSVLYKPSLLIWAPIFLVALVKNKIKINKLIISGILFLTLIYLVSYPFNPVEIHPLVWFIQTMLTKILPGVMDQVTANAMNFWALIYGLKPKLDYFLILNVISARNLSLLIFGIFYLFLLKKLYKNYSIQYFLLTLVTVSLTAFSFMTRMHERYSYPALIPLLLLCHYDRKFIKYFIFLSITHFLNVYSSWGIPAIAPLNSILNNDFVVRFISFVNVIITLKLVFIHVSKKIVKSKN